MGIKYKVDRLYIVFIFNIPRKLRVEMLSFFNIFNLHYIN